MARRPMEAAGAVDAQNAPTAPWKTRRRVSHSYHRRSHRNRGLECYPCSRFTLLPMFPAAHLKSENFFRTAWGNSAKANCALLKR